MLVKSSSAVEEIGAANAAVDHEERTVVDARSIRETAPPSFFWVTRVCWQGRSHMVRAQRNSEAWEPATLPRRRTSQKFLEKLVVQICLNKGNDIWNALCFGVEDLFHIIPCLSLSTDNPVEIIYKSYKLCRSIAPMPIAAFKFFTCKIWYTGNAKHWKDTSLSMDIVYLMTNLLIIWVAYL